MTGRVLQVHKPACDDRGWVIRTREQFDGIVSERQHWYDDESSADQAYHRFSLECERTGAR